MPSKPAPAVQKLHAAEPREDEEADDVVFKLPPGASRNTRRVARYLQKDLHFPELLLMLIFMVREMKLSPLLPVQKELVLWNSNGITAH